MGHLYCNGRMPMSAALMLMVCCLRGINLYMLFPSVCLIFTFSRYGSCVFTLHMTLSTWHWLLCSWQWQWATGRANEAPLASSWGDIHPLG